MVLAPVAALAGSGFIGSLGAVRVPAGLHGSVQGGRQAVNGAGIQIYASGTNGIGSTAAPLLSNPVKSDSTGGFSIPTSFKCPFASSQLYLVARGSNPGLTSGADNPNLSLMAMLGSCSGLSASTAISVNEVTTIGSVWPLALYMKSPSELGSTAGGANFMTAASSVSEFVNITQGSSPGIGTITTTPTAPSPAKLAFLQQPSNAFTQASISPAVRVVIEDTNGNTVTSATNPVTLALVGGSGLGGTLTVAPQNGIATFSNLTVSIAGTYMVLATSPSLTSATSTSFTITTSSSKTYYLSPTGNDLNSGLTSSLPWLTPHHSVNCGDVIVAAPSNAYVNTNFGWNMWGTVTCPSGTNVAWLKCAIFDACKISATEGQGMWVTQSYWGIEGWEVTAAAADQYGTCFFVSPYATKAEITHIIFASNVANGCSNYGFASNYVGSASADYVAFIGNIAYNTAQGGTACASGFSVLEPHASDSVPGTHIYLAGNFSWDNLDADPCDGTAPTDGEGIILDGLGVHSYNQQVAVVNNLTFMNGGEGILVGGIGGSTLAPVYVDHNTLYGNNSDPNQHGFDVGELELTKASHTEASYNLAVVPSARNAGATTSVYGLSVVTGDGTDDVDNNVSYGSGGHNSVIYSSGSFAYGPDNIFGMNPALANPVGPGAPNCGSYSSVPACMTAVIANFTPTTAAATSYGYQIPSATPTYDPLFPQWLCNVNLPSGLVTIGCLTASTQSEVLTDGTSADERRATARPHRLP